VLPRTSTRRIPVPTHTFATRILPEASPGLIMSPARRSGSKLTSHRYQRKYTAAVWCSLVMCGEWHRLETHIGHWSAPLRPTGDDQLEDLVIHHWQLALMSNDTASPWTKFMNWLLITQSVHQTGACFWWWWWWWWWWWIRWFSINSNHNS